MNRFRAKFRLFRIWQKTGKGINKFNHNKKTTEKGFFSGAFEDIPFFNVDARRTFVHVLLRPGYMIRDFISGRDRKFLPPLTALILFYTFLYLLISIVAPSTKTNAENLAEAITSAKVEMEEGASEDRTEEVQNVLMSLGDAISWFYLDQHPELVDTRLKASVASIEGNLRSKGVANFLFDLLMLSFCLWVVFRRRKGLRYSAAATTAAYILCQFCFFSFFAAILTLGKIQSPGAMLCGILLLIDLKELFGENWKRTLCDTIRVGLLFYGLVFLLIIAAIVVAVRVAAV